MLWLESRQRCSVSFVYVGMRSRPDSPGKGGGYTGICPERMDVIQVQLDCVKDCARPSRLRRDKNCLLIAVQLTLVDFRSHGDDVRAG